MRLFVGLPRRRGWAALPSRPAAACRNPPLRSGSSISFRPFGCGPPLARAFPVAFRRPPRLPGKACGFLRAEAGACAKRANSRATERAAPATAFIRRSRTRSSPNWSRAGCPGCSPGARPRAAWACRPTPPQVGGYSGINVLILWLAVIEKGFPSQQWLTFRQALDLGGNVRKGEHGTTVCYADRFIPKNEVERAQQAGEDPKAIPFLKRFTVFNVAQCDGLPATICRRAAARFR